MHTSPKQKIPQKELLRQALEHINSDDYADWVRVGHALKSEGEEFFDLWAEWSSRSAKFPGTDICAKKWRGFHPEKTSAGAIIKEAKRNGWEDPRKKTFEDRPYNWEDTIEYDTPTDQGSDQQPEPVKKEWDPAGDLRAYLQVMFKPDDLIDYCSKNAIWKDKKQKWEPGKATTARVGDLIALLDAGRTVGQTLNGVNEEAGCWVRVNAMDGKAGGNDNVTRRDHVLIESDEMTLQEQWNFYKASRLPITAVVSSGGKSLHALVKLGDDLDADEYASRTAELYDWCKERGFIIDPPNKNPSRYSRLPGVMRNGKRQQFAPGMGAASWEAWKAEQEPVYREETIDQEETCFVCAEIADADALVKAGANAIAVKPDAVDGFIQRMKAATPAVVFILCLDAETEKKLRELSTKTIQARFSDAYSDAETIAEKYRNYPEQFARDVATNKRRARKRFRFSSMSVRDYLTRGIYEEDLQYFSNYQNRKPGFSNMDDNLTLYPGLAFLAGASSLGKTTFVCNLAWNLAKAGEHVLFYSLEQEPIEIITKLIAAEHKRRFPESITTNIDIKNKNAFCKDERIQEVREAVIDAVGDRLIIKRCDFTVTVDDIAKDIEGYIKHTGRSPITIIDYLQLISPGADFRGDQRAAVDESVKALKALQRSEELLIIAISNVNRSSYDKAANYSAFKESGLIEFSGDYVWMLELGVIATRRYWWKQSGKNGYTLTTEHERQEILEKESAKTEKYVRFVSLKSRNQKQKWNAEFTYRTENDLFEPYSGLDWNCEIDDGYYNPFEDKKPAETKAERRKAAKAADKAGKKADKGK